MSAPIGAGAKTRDYDLARAKHYIFLSNEADVLRGIRSYLAAAHMH